MKHRAVFLLKLALSLFVEAFFKVADKGCFKEV